MDLSMNQGSWVGYSGDLGSRINVPFGDLCGIDRGRKDFICGQLKPVFMWQNRLKERDLA